MKILLLSLCLLVAAPIGAQAATKPATAHDSFSKARVISDMPFDVTLKTVGATLERGEPQTTCGGANSSIWLRLNMKDQLPMGISTFDSNYDTVVGVYTGTKLNKLQQVACNDDAGTRTQSMVAWDAVPNTTYWIQVGAHSGRGGNLRFRLWISAHRERGTEQSFNVSSPFKVAAVPDMGGVGFSAELDASYCINSLCIGVMQMRADGHRRASTGEGAQNACAYAAGRAINCQ